MTIETVRMTDRGPRHPRVTHGPELERTLEERRALRTIRRLGTVIVCLSVVLGYLVSWAEGVGL